MRDNILLADSICPECHQPVCTPIFYFGLPIYLDIYNSTIHKCKGHDDYCMCERCWFSRYIFLNRDELYRNYPECFTPFVHKLMKLVDDDGTKTFEYFLDHYKSEQPQESDNGKFDEIGLLRQ